MSYDHAEYFDQISDEQITRLINVNAVATTKVCRLALAPKLWLRQTGPLLALVNGAALALIPRSNSEACRRCRCAA